MHLEHTCPLCGAKQDEVACVADHTMKPSPGDMTICSSCLSPLIFGENVEVLRQPTDEEMLQVAGDELFLHSMAICRWARDTMIREGRLTVAELALEICPLLPEGPPPAPLGWEDFGPDEEDD